jgi:hypothetical protein
MGAGAPRRPAPAVEQDRVQAGARLAISLFARHHAERALGRHRVARRPCAAGARRRASSPAWPSAPGVRAARGSRRCLAASHFQGSRMAASASASLPIRSCRNSRAALRGKRVGPVRGLELGPGVPEAGNGDVAPVSHPRQQAVRQASAAGRASGAAACPGPEPARPAARPQSRRIPSVRRCIPGIIPPVKTAAPNARLRCARARRAGRAPSAGQRLGKARRASVSSRVVAVSPGDRSLPSIAGPPI